MQEVSDLFTKFVILLLQCNISILCFQVDTEVDAARLSPYPTLVVKPAENARSLLEGEPKEVELWFERRLLCNCPDILAGFSALFSAYYVFDLKYPKEVINTMTFLDGHVLSANKELKLGVSVQRIVNVLHA